MKALAALGRVQGGEQVKVLSRQTYLPSSGNVDLLVYRENDSKVGYRVLLSSKARAEAAIQGTALPDEPACFPDELVDTAQVLAEQAIGGPKGTDFSKDQPAVAKTLLHFGNDVEVMDWRPWRPARLHVVACGGPAHATLLHAGAVDMTLASTMSCRLIAILLCALFYVLAATATFFIHKMHRPLQTDEDSPRPEDRKGTHYASWWRHLDPVVLTAGGNGRGSATKLQILFFSIVTFGLVSYLWMQTGHLAELSTTVLLLMGISGFGGVAAGGTELVKNRLSFDNWAWLVNRRWLPKGGVAEVNRAEWKDIFTTDGEFDVYRFQMVTFSALVGIALLGAGSQLADLATFDIPNTLLGILGLSQVVYVAGKLTAPPTISNLDEQIGKLQLAEKRLRDALDKTNLALLNDVHVVWKDDDALIAARTAHGDYLQTWRTARTMFESTLGRLVPPAAKRLRPAFGVPELVSGQDDILRSGKAGMPYKTTLLAQGGQAPYAWALESGDLPSGIVLNPGGELTGTPTFAGLFCFKLIVTDSANTTRLRTFSLRIDAA